METVRLFMEWFAEQHMDKVFVACSTVGLCLGIPFLIVDLIPSMEGFRFGWFYSLARIPVYTCTTIALLILLWIVAVFTIEWVERQKEDFKQFVKRNQD